MNTKVEEALADLDVARDESAISQSAYASIVQHIAQQDATIARLTAALQEARDLVESWAAYADPYFQEKHGLADDLAELDAALNQGEVK